MPVIRFLALAALAIGVALLSMAPLPTRAGLLLVVNSTADTVDSAPGDGVCDGGGVCTLRAAIEEANATLGADTINFAIAGCIDFQSGQTCDPGTPVRTIIPGSPLPGIFPDAVTVDGTTQPGFAGSPIIELNGQNAGPDAFGLAVAADDTIIRGLVINRFDGDGVQFQGVGGRIEGNYIGTDVSGTTALGNRIGLWLILSENATIGGTGPGARNLISGNNNVGVDIDRSSGALVEGNYIGTDITGAAALGNVGGGILLSTEDSNTIGGASLGAGNLISGNGEEGIALTGPGTTVVRGNRIGTNAAGTEALPNANHGILVMSAENTIGGVNSGEGNVISGHTTGAGIRIAVDVAEGNTIQGNYIGTDASGTSALPNHWGVLVEGSNNTIGGTAAGAGNVISGNSTEGVAIPFKGNVVVQGNFIGTDASGHNALGNGGNGVSIFTPDFGIPMNNVIGGETVGARNVISGNRGSGIAIDESPGNVVQGNYIGTDVTGEGKIANTIGVFIQRARDNTVGGEGPGARNLISGNQASGVSIFSGSNSKVRGNFIGTNKDGTAALGNGDAGVFIFDSAGGSHVIGGSSPATRNLISANKFGVSINNASGNAVQGNYIGTDVTGDAALGNTASGVFVQGTGNLIGGESAGMGNLISGNAGDGVIIVGSSHENKIQGNFIGTNAAGTASVGKQRVGIEVGDVGSSFVGANLVGGRAPDARNLISGNETGILSYGSGSNAIEGNYIGTDVTGTRALHAITGVFLLSAGNTVGGTAPGTPNVISGHDGDAVRIEGSSNAVQGNYMGTDVSGTSPIPNGNGISIFGASFGASNNTIGGTEAGAPNVIAFSGGYGVYVQGPAATGNTIRANSIYSSGLTGIETINGGNTELPAPVIRSLGPATGTACSGCIVDVFSDNEDEGRVYHGSATADASGNWSFAGATVGPNVTATATDAGNNTSEFSPPFVPGGYDAAALKISVPGEGQATTTVQVRVQNSSGRTATISVYTDVIPPGGTSNPYGCTSGRFIETREVLAPGEKRTVSSLDGTFSCADAAGARGKKYTVVAVVDMRGDDLPACGEGQLQSMGCYGALADDDVNPANNRITRTCCKVH